MASYISIWLGITDEADDSNNLVKNYTKEKIDLYDKNAEKEEDFREAVFYEDMV
ncbi:MAG: hypothetical protein ABF289_11735 [Clostridiales bacterium]